ncbi:hypothetical protein [Acanthopleuribacter pedis]|uniref:Uncharacterized protein n=1 Tax=Acanthopleuribacter pedis TaxID=442870 RepID=A0A8J7QEE2_9BACT|nr:hypothetical protein [Acanthopleuribacter pedis]MBO1318155.1 hypothetical protein [Acanthopleuribacter pedis]
MRHFILFSFFMAASCSLTAQTPPNWTRQSSFIQQEYDAFRYASDRIYAHRACEGIDVYELNNLSEVRLLNQIAAPADALVALHIHGETLFRLTENALHTYSLADRDQPVETAVYDLSHVAHVRNMAVVDDMITVLTENYRGGGFFVRFNRNAVDPRPTTIEIPDYPGYDREVINILVKDTIFYVIPRGSGTKIVELVSESEARYLGNIQGISSPYNGAFLPNDDFLVLDSGSGFYVFDVSNPEEPFLLGRDRR